MSVVSFLLILLFTHLRPSTKGKGPRTSKNPKPPPQKQKVQETPKDDEFSDKDPRDVDHEEEVTDHGDAGPPVPASPVGGIFNTSMSSILIMEEVTFWRPFTIKKNNVIDYIVLITCQVIFSDFNFMDEFTHGDPNHRIILT